MVILRRAIWVLDFRSLTAKNRGEQMKVIGLTGGIGCGKSAVARKLAEEAGVESLDCDRIAWETYQPHTAIYQRLVRRFGKGVVASSGKIDRARLGSLVFSDNKAQADLDAIIHPAVIEQLQEQIGINQQRGTELLIVEGALLLNSPHVDLDLFDIIIQLELSRSEQLARLKGRDKRTQEKIERIIDIQREMDQRSAPDYIIDASGTVDEVVEHIKEILRRLKGSQRHLS
ncbi:TPA: dephospho-CoA kinase [Candidatus Acetothermia bacterium]|nr:dephospho-CoA kinase [Candidatus Acetothermia bacterium]